MFYRFIFVSSSERLVSSYQQNLSLRNLVASPGPLSEYKWRCCSGSVWPVTVLRFSGFLERSVCCKMLMVTYYVRTFVVGDFPYLLRYWVLDNVNLEKTCQRMSSFIKSWSCENYFSDVLQSPSVYLIFTRSPSVRSSWQYYWKCNVIFR